MKHGDVGTEFINPKMHERKVADCEDGCGFGGERVVRLRADCEAVRCFNRERIERLITNGVKANGDFDC